MITRWKAELEKAMFEFVEKMGKDEGALDGMYTDALPLQMAAAAELILDTSVDTQKWLEANT